MPAKSTLTPADIAAMERRAFTTIAPVADIHPRWRQTCSDVFELAAALREAWAEVAQLKGDLDP